MDSYIPKKMCMLSVIAYYNLDNISACHSLRISKLGPIEVSVTILLFKYFENELYHFVGIIFNGNI